MLTTLLLARRGSSHLECNRNYWLQKLLSKIFSIVAVGSVLGVLVKSIFGKISHKGINEFGTGCAQQTVFGKVISMVLTTLLLARQDSSHLECNRNCS